MTEEFARELGACIDRMDAAPFVEYLSEDAVFRFGNMEPVVGRAAIREGVDAFFGMIRSIRHEVLRTHAAGDYMIVEMRCTYEDQWGRTLRVPVCNVFRMAPNGLIEEYLIYIDNHALFVPPAEAGEGRMQTA